MASPGDGARIGSAWLVGPAQLYRPTADPNDGATVFVDWLFAADAPPPDPPVVVESVSFATLSMPGLA